MANQPIFVAAYRHDYATLVAARANQAQDLFTPGASGTRLHAIALANDGEAPALVEFGAYDVVGDDVEVDIAPGSTPEEDPFTVTRAAGAWPALETGLVLTLSKGAVANRGDYRLSSRTDTVLTRENTPGNAIAAAAGIDAAIYHWRPIWSATVPARAGYDGYPAYAGLDPGQMPWRHVCRRTPTRPSPATFTSPCSAAITDGELHRHCRPAAADAAAASDQTAGEPALRRVAQRRGLVSGQGLRLGYHLLLHGLRDGRRHRPHVRDQQQS